MLPLEDEVTSTSVTPHSWSHGYVVSLGDSSTGQTLKKSREVNSLWHSLILLYPVREFCPSENQ